MSRSCGVNSIDSTPQECHLPIDKGKGSLLEYLVRAIQSTNLTPR
ncbi:hypothetical protein K7432_012074 [Basidiobolus ranarum]|uniref:Uncharacterized protein n=1 Tax=Basidiobolus ranarum TaxID=34480 RepID=A0ABR2WLF7_9FUNG